MGCSPSNFVSETNAVFTPTNIGTKGDYKNVKLTNNDINKIRHCWELVQDKKELGLLVMIRIFTKHPEISHKWIFAKGLQTEQEMRENPQIAYHASKIIELFSKIITSFAMTNHFEFDELTNLGKNHYHYGVRPSDFEFFEECLIFCLENMIANERIFDFGMKNVWNKFFWTIVAKLCSGIYIAEIDELEANNSRKEKM